MAEQNAVVGIFDSHIKAETSIKELQRAGFEIDCPLKGCLLYRLCRIASCFLCECSGRKMPGDPRAAKSTRGDPVWKPPVFRRCRPRALQ